MDQDVGDVEEYWTGVVDTSRTPSPAPRPAKRTRQSWDDTASSVTLAPYDPFNATLLEQSVVDERWLEPDDVRSGRATKQEVPSTFGYAAQVGSFRDVFSSNGSMAKVERKAKMQTGCIPCLYVAAMPLSQRSF